MQLITATMEFWVHHYLPAKQVLEEHGIVPQNGSRVLTPAQQELGLRMVKRFEPPASPTNHSALKMIHSEVLDQVCKTRIEFKHTL